ELSQHLRCRLGARHPPIKFDDVTKFARERTATGELHADKQIVFEFEQVEPRDRRLGDINLILGGAKVAGALACFPGSDEVSNDPLRFAQHPEVGRSIDVWAGANVWPTDRN